MASVREYVPHSGRVGYSVSSDDGRRVFLVTPDAGPGRFSPVRAWEVWKSDSLNVRRRVSGTNARDIAIAEAVRLVDSVSAPAG